MTIEVLPGKNYTLAQVAAWLEHDDVTWLYRNRKRLEREGFPPSLSRVGHPRFSGEALLAWRARPAPQAADKPVFQGPNVVDYSSELARRAETLLAAAGSHSRRRP